MVPPRIQKLILADYRVGVLVMPSGDRASLGAEALSGLDQIARANKLTEDKRLVRFSIMEYSARRDTLQR
ncbi:MAG: hypothetical protein DMD95_21690 [Candidatus Rokuibacteriota bacterium]|nr:MAG: hypothetical protein DMD95_21690 [Candidatus Rokubacteria bacterium]